MIDPLEKATLADVVISALSDHPFKKSNAKKNNGVPDPQNCSKLVSILGIDPFKLKLDALRRFARKLRAIEKKCAYTRAANLNSKNGRKKM